MSASRWVLESKEAIMCAQEWDLATRFEALSPTPGTVVRFSDKLTDSLADITRMINEHKEMIDAIQDVGIQLTGELGTLHSLTVRYAGIVNGVLDTLLPLLKRVPLVPQPLLQLATSMERVTQGIIDHSATTAEAITHVNAGLRTADVSQLRGYSDELQEVTRVLTSILPAGK
jgi:hypothetical protein